MIADFHVNFIKSGRKRHAVKLEMRNINVRLKSELKMPRACRVILSLVGCKITCELKMSRTWRMILSLARDEITCELKMSQA